MQNESGAFKANMILESAPFILAVNSDAQFDCWNISMELMTFWLQSVGSDDKKSKKGAEKCGKFLPFLPFFCSLTKIMKQQKESWRRECCILTLRLSVPEFDKYFPFVSWHFTNIVQWGKHEETKQKRQEYSDDGSWLGLVYKQGGQMLSPQGVPIWCWLV